MTVANARGVDINLMLHGWNEWLNSDALAARPKFMTLGVSASAVGVTGICDGIHCDHIAGMERAKHPYIGA